MKKPLISTEFKNRIEMHIAEVEKETSVEFVTLLTRRSHHYLGFRIALALFFALVEALMPSSFFDQIAWPVHGLSAIAMGFLVFAATGFSWVLHLMLPKSLQLHTVETAAKLAFLKNEVFKTYRRSGILIYISELERAVYLLADRGLSEAIPHKDWAELATILAGELATKGAGETFIDALDRLKERVKVQFPPDSEHHDELSKDLRGNDNE